MYARGNDIGNPVDSTYEWIIEHPSYSEWLQTQSGLLWIKGKPGAGKSTLIKYALQQDIRQQKGRDQTIIVSFFFNGRGSPLERTALGLYRSLLHQLLRLESGRLLRLTTVYKERCQTMGMIEEKWNWHERELEDLLSDLLLTLVAVHSVRLYIDALDEVGEEVAVQLVEYFQSLVTKASNVGKSLGICFSCRHYPLISLDGLTICLENENSADIQTYVYQKFKANSIEQRKAQILAPDILDRANGVFQWITLVLPQVIRECKRRRPIRVIQSYIRKLPSELLELYATILAGIDDGERFESLNLMRWVCFALRPLSLKEIRHAIAIDPNTPCTTLHESMDGESVTTNEDMRIRIIDLSKGLAETRVHNKQDFVQFIHESVKDFLVQGGLQSLESIGVGTITGRSNLSLAWACVRYFTMDEIVARVAGITINHPFKYEVRKHLESTYPLMCYAILSWVQHAAQAGEEQLLTDDLFQLFHQFCRPSERKLDHWIWLHSDLRWWSHPRPTEGMTILHVIAMHGFSNVLLRFLDSRDVTVDSKDNGGRTPLSWAAGQGHEQIVRLLVDRDDVEADSNDNDSTTPLSWAAAQGHEAVVKLLVDRDDVEADSKDDTGQTPLSLAAEQGHVAVVELLVDRDDVEADSKDDMGRTPLYWAAKRGHFAVVELLVDRDDVEADSKDILGRTPLSLAAERGHVTVVELLVNRDDVEADSKDILGQTPLSLAAEQGHVTVVELLVDRDDVEADSKDDMGRSPLYWAAEQGHVAVVELLVDRDDVEADSKDNDGQTPLSRAAWRGHFAVVELLVDRDDVEADSKDILGRTPLSRAAWQGHESVVKLLVNRDDVEADLEGEEGWTPLS